MNQDIENIKEQLEEVIKKKFEDKFCTLLNYRIIVGGELKENYLLLNTNNGTEVSDFISSLIADEVRKFMVEKILLEMKGWVKADTSITGIGLLNIMQSKLDEINKI